jgi:hypothetical protein
LENTSTTPWKEQGRETGKMDIPKYIEEREVARITGFALSTLRNNRFKGAGIPYLKIGRSVRYNLKDVVDFMEKHRIETHLQSDLNPANREISA